MYQCKNVCIYACQHVPGMRIISQDRLPGMDNNPQCGLPLCGQSPGSPWPQRGNHITQSDYLGQFEAELETDLEYESARPGGFTV